MKSKGTPSRYLFYFCSNSPMYLYVVVRLKSHTLASSLTFTCMLRNTNPYVYRFSCDIPVECCYNKTQYQSEGMNIHVIATRTGRCDRGAFPGKLGEALSLRQPHASLAAAGGGGRAGGVCDRGHEI